MAGSRVREDGRAARLRDRLRAIGRRRAPRDRTSLYAFCMERIKRIRRLVVAVAIVPDGGALTIYSGKRHVTLKGDDLAQYIGKRAQRRNRGLDALVVGDLTAVEGDVEVRAHEHRPEHTGDTDQQAAHACTSADFSAISVTRISGLCGCSPSVYRR